MPRMSAASWAFISAPFLARRRGAESVPQGEILVGGNVYHIAYKRGAVVADRADEYRRRAQQCLDMARTFGDRDARVILAHLAQAWLRLGDNCQDAPISA